MEYFAAVRGVIAVSNEVFWQSYNVWVEITKISSVLNDTN